MTYQIVDNFAAGLDTRKSPLTSPAGTLTRLVNAAITPGGEIAKRRAFVEVASVPGTFGLASTEANLYVFGRNVAPTIPSWTVPGVTLKGQNIPNADATLVQMDYDTFDGQIYLACRTGTGTLPSAPTAAQNPHYYNAVATEGAGKGYYVRTYQSKVYSILGKNLWFSAVGDPKLWNTGTGHGFINLSMQDADFETLTSLEVYYDKLAVFSSEAVQIWAVDPDPAQNAFTQLLRAAGTFSPRSPLQYGSGDVLYLDQSGIRSLKAKDSSNSAAVSDIGSPVDPTVQTMLTVKGAAYMDKAIALLEPSVGRFWMVFPSEILVLSYFPGPKITAWSQYTIPEIGVATVQYAATCGGKIFLRTTDDKIYVYGGNDGTVFSNCGVEVRLPYLDGKKPGHKKQFAALDATVTGTWTAKVSYNFNDPESEETIGVLTEPTWNAGAGEVQGYDSHFSLRFYNADANAATISNCAIHYEMADSEGMRTVNQPTLDDLLYVGAWVCDADRKELALTRDPDDYVRLAHDAWESGFKYVVLDNALPVFVFGAKKIGDTALVWGFKTEQGCKAMRVVTKFIHRTMIPALRDVGIRKAVCIVHPDNRASQVWLRHLGFTPRATSRDFGTRQEVFILFQRDEPDARPS